MTTAKNEIPDYSIRICADRGGTFCDVHGSYPDPDNPEGERKEVVVKLCMSRR
jgi:5-oxoprolinase (ATP-hydrolysing)